MNSSISNKQFVGIDLGTSNTGVAFFDETGKPKIIPNIDGEMLTPSVVYVGPGCREILVGTAAKNMEMLEPDRVFKEFKREVGTDKIYALEEGKEITPEFLQTQLLIYIHNSVIKYFGDSTTGNIKVVVTCPAQFKEHQRQSIKKSAKQAGFDILAIINEPTSAGLAYGVNEKQGDRLVMVSDFGGGTYDSSLISYAGGEATVLASNGDKQLGGKDVDDILLDLVQKAFQNEHNLIISAQSHPADWFNIREEVIRQKHMLSSRTEVKLVARIEGKQVVIPVNREMLNMIVKQLMDRIENITLETINKAKVDKKEIKHVLTIGGSSRLISFQESIKKMFGENCILAGSVSPDMAVAEGAVIHAAKLISSKGKTIVDEGLRAIPAPSISHVDCMPHSLGVAVFGAINSGSHKLYCSAILESNTPIPCQATKAYSSVEDAQTEFHVQVLQGEEDQKFEDCLVVGDRRLNFPARPSDKDSIEVVMAYDNSGMVNVSVKDLISGNTEDITIDFYSNN